MKTKLFRYLGYLIVLLMVITPTSAQSQAAADKIESNLLSKFDVEGSSDFIVRFTTQADLGPAESMDWEARGEFVVQALTEAAKVQERAKAYLDERGIIHETFIAGNDLYVFQGVAADAYALAELAEVDSLRATRTYFITPGEFSLQAYDLPENQPDALAWGISYVKADQFWASFGVQGDNIVVANIDTGVQWDHPALDQAFKCPGDPGNPACWEDPSNICPGGTACDNNGHGTHTMGTMVGDDDPSLTWQAGMAPNSQWIACKGCESNSCSDYALNTCADWILQPGGSPNNRPHVVNNSWGGGGGDTWYLAKVQAWTAAGIFPAFSAGNAGPSCGTLGSPGDYQISFSSAAIDSAGTIASFSSRGPCAFGHDPYTKPNISAPGVSVCSSVPGNGWSCGYSGTSMASPHTAGAVSLLWSCNPDLVSQIDLTMQILQNTTNPTPDGNCGAPPDGEGNYTYGYGYLDVLNVGLGYCADVDLGTLNGYVYDDYGNPVEGANVSAVPAGMSNMINAITDPDGYYEMNLVVGTYNVTASKPNYTSQTVDGVEIFTDTITTQDFVISFLGSWMPGPTMCFDLTRMDAEFYPATGKVYILGGRSGADTLGNIYAFDPVDESCVDTGAVMPVPISNYTINLVNNGTDDVLCTFGGRNAAGNQILNVQCYNPITNGATSVANLPSAYSGYVPGGQAVVDNMVYVFGGFNPNASPYELSRTDRFNPLTNTFTQVGNLSLGRAYIDVAVVDGKIYTFGGTVFDGAGLVAQTRTEVMADPGGAGTWDNAAVAELPVASAEGRAFGFNSNSPYLPNQIVIAGGGQWPGETAEALVYDIASDTYDYTFPNLINARRNHGGAFVPLVSEDPADGLPGMWVFGGRQVTDDPPYMPAEFFPLAAVGPEPEIDAWKDAPATAAPGEVITYTITIEAAMLFDGMYMVDPLPEGIEFAGNLTWTDGEAWYDEDDNTVYWEYHEPEAVGEPVSMPYGVFNPDAVLELQAQGYPKAVPAAPNPLNVLWDQYANWNSSDYASQDFEAAYDAYDIYAGDDFENAVPWTIDTIVTRGGWGSFVNLNNATAIHWYIYADYPGKPAGFPGDGTEFWSLTLAPDDPQVGLGVYETEDVVLTLDTPISLPPGHWWLVFYPSLEFAQYGQYGWSGTADPIWGYAGMQANPNGGFGMGDDWWTNSAGVDHMFRLEGVVGVEPVLVEISFDVTIMGVHGDLIVNEGWAGILEGAEQYFEAVTEVVGTPGIDVDPLELWAEVLVDTTETEPLNICNIGTAPLVWEIFEMEASPLTVTRTVNLPAGPAAAPGQSAVAAGPFQNRLASTYSLEGLVGVLSGPDVLLVNADEDNDEGSIIQDLLQAYGTLGAVDLFDARYDTPSLALLQDYDVVLTWSNYVYADAVGIGDVLADYVDGGGKVIDLMFGLDPSWGYQGRFRTDGYTAMTTTSYTFLTECLGSYNPDHPIMAGVTDVCEYYLGTGTALTAGSSEIAQWAGGELFVAAKDDQTVVTINGYVGYYYQWTGQMPDVLHNAILWLADVEPVDISWLSEDPVSGEVPVGECQEVQVTFDATGMEPGDYFAGLRILSNDPEISQVDIPVTMTVYEQAFLQVAHLAPFAEDASVTITLNGAPALIDFNYGDSTVYIPLPAGEYDVAVIPTGAIDPAIEATVTLIADTYYTVIAVGDDVNQDLGLMLLEDDLTEPEAGKFHLRLGHLAPFAPGLATADIRLQDGTPVLLDVDFGDVTGFIPLDVGSYDLIITTPGGDVILIDPLPVDFAEGMIISAFATGEGVNHDLGVFALPAGVEGFFLPLTEYGVELAPAEDALSGEPGDTVEYTLTLTNTGNVPDTFEITVEGNDWDVHLPETSFDLEAGENVDVILHVTIPADAEDGDFDVVTVTATSTGDAEVSASVVLTTTAMIEEEPEPDWFFLYTPLVIKY
jgi:hypothetical protein